MIELDTTMYNVKCKDQPCNGKLIIEDKSKEAICSECGAPHIWAEAHNQWLIK
jgi:hypothetical protein